MSGQYPFSVNRPAFSPSSSSSSTSSASSLSTPIEMPSFSMDSFHFPGAAAPLPSPCLEQQHQFFSAPQQPFNTPFGSPLDARPTQHLFQEQHQYQQHQQQQQQQQPRYNLRSHAQRQHQQQRTSNAGFSNPAQQFPESRRYSNDDFENPIQQRQSSTSSTGSEANLHLRDFSLIAEAAKRAQIAVVTRDLEEMEF